EPGQRVAAKLLIGGGEHPRHERFDTVAGEGPDRGLQRLDALPMKIDGARRRGFEQGLARAEVVRCGAGGQTRPVVDLPMRQTPDALVGEYADGGVKDLRAAFGIW